MWPFKQESKTWKVKTLVVKDPIKIDVGIAKIEITFLDKRIFHILVYGNAYCYGYEHKWKKNELGSYEDAYISQRIYLIKQASRDYILSYHKDYEEGFMSVIVDDPQNPTLSMRGEIIEKKILEIKPYFVEIGQYELVEKVLEEPNE